MKYTDRVKHYITLALPKNAAREQAKFDCKYACQRNIVSREDAVYAFRNAVHCMHLYGAPVAIKEHANGIAVSLPQATVKSVLVQYCDETRDAHKRTPPCFSVWSDIPFLDDPLNLTHGSAIREPFKTKVAQGATVRVTCLVNDWKDTEKWIKRIIYCEEL
jgi:hypothetical protein